MNNSSSQKKSIKNIKNTPESSIRVFHGVRFDVQAFELSGRDGKKVRREAVIHPGSVVILPILDANHILLIRNERFAVNEILWELPAGTLEPNELPEKTAFRELIEETGYQATSVKHMLSFFTSPGICNELMDAYVAEGLTFVGQHLDESEKITVEKLSWDNVKDMMRDGSIHDGKTIATLLYYDFIYQIK